MRSEHAPLISIQHTVGEGNEKIISETSRDDEEQRKKRNSNSALTQRVGKQMPSWECYKSMSFIYKIRAKLG